MDFDLSCSSFILHLLYNTYWLLAQKLQQPLGRLSKACSVTVDWELVMRRTIGIENQILNILLAQLSSHSGPFFRAAAI